MIRFFVSSLLVVPIFSTLTGQDSDDINRNGLSEPKDPPSDPVDIRRRGYIPDPLRMRTAKKRTRDHYDLTVKIPENFDAAENWPECADVINNIRDQSNCGSCWAVAAAGVISDRICISTKGKYKVSISSIATASCGGRDGCHGGGEFIAFHEFIADGLPTGSEVDKHEGCQPYPFKKCAHHINSTVYPPCDSIPSGHADTCSHKCQAGYPRKYEDDLFFGKDEYILLNEEATQREILANGSHDPDETKGGGHAVRIVGENGTKYWKIANSWNEGWGEHGFLRIIRGIDDGGIDSLNAAVSIDTDRLPKKWATYAPRSRV
ncbi:unnamed protein product [Bursaphelenchus xylophilus]|uniref:(pine wood nematode) hypothetical protein n=1 Tax=Bursaphelenchus xylophilus TaxID=6326 RepID=A0A7I8XKM4_BURXY|nr:unnamed protein product [Bursaphelenchus xylophilus]CAG9120596.1 unnamed protein product [Bursaphelenchus xylophilus]